MGDVKYEKRGLKLSEYAPSGTFIFLVNDGAWGTILGLVLKRVPSGSDNWDMIDVLWAIDGRVPEITRDLHLDHGKEGKLRIWEDMDEKAIKSWRQR